MNEPIVTVIHNEGPFVPWLLWTIEGDEEVNPAYCGPAEPGNADASPPPNQSNTNPSPPPSQAE
jgi:hypothetical protein